MTLKCMCSRLFIKDKVIEEVPCPNFQPHVIHQPCSAIYVYPHKYNYILLYTLLTILYY